MGMKSAGGAEFLQVSGGGGAFIVRSTGRKDRHSKVFTSKGLRDRRVRLSAHTAIQFYDVQDRLGYDRPSKAVDWLIAKAKSAIDKLFDLPPCNPHGIESDFVDDLLFQSQLGANLTQPSMDPVGDFQNFRELGLSLQTQNYAAGSGNSGLEIDGGFGSNPFLNQSSVVFPLRGPLQSSFESPVPEYAWSDTTVASAGKRHPIPINEDSSPSSSRFVSGGLPHLDVHGRIQNGGEGKVPFNSSSFSGR